MAGTNLDIFLAQTADLPKLSHADQVALLGRARSGDRAARDDLILSCLPWAVKIASSYRCAEPVEEMVSWGMPGLCEAVDKWVPGRGKLTTIVTICVRNAISEAIHELRYPVLPPRSHNKSEVAATQRRAECARAGAMPLENAGHLCSEASDPTAACEEADDRRVYIAARDDLPDDLREIVLARERGELMLTIGNRMGVSRQAVFYFLGQAKQRLREAVGEQPRKD